MPILDVTAIDTNRPPRFFRNTICIAFPRHCQARIMQGQEKNEPESICSTWSCCEAAVSEGVFTLTTIVRKMALAKAPIQ
jgi:hypothetical protein